ncbi:MAG: tRNA uridine-5-carboxymethylaminomethyl(34) synthesis GTPase MnmE [Acidobacteria bacterium]|nr:tRNA uridine-5-carboxymethylaminomethyl(34) synthesis GTPase MnmE [Acidobacteriota bacterium]
MFSTDDTIVAIATPPGRGGIGVVRLSGSDAHRIAGEMTGRQHFEPRHATFCVLPADDSTQTGDEVVVTAFPAPHSYTGEDVVEISAHGSPVILDGLLARAMARGARLAEPGEFTLRSVLHGKRDLVQAEAVADLIDAVTPAQARAAFDQLQGTLTHEIGAIEQALFDLMARLEASLDFPEEGYHFAERPAVITELQQQTTRLDALLATARGGRLLRDGAVVTIVGTPNAGKSSLFNALLRANRAIVTPVAGTTRDLLTERVEIAGYAITLVDTAGLRDAADAIEHEGVTRAKGAIDVADLAIVVLDRSRPLSADDRDVLRDTASMPRVIVANKSDLPSAWPQEDDARALSPIEVSAATAHGLDVLESALLDALTSERDATRRQDDRDEAAPASIGVVHRGATTSDHRDPVRVTNLRHIDLLSRARTAIDRAHSGLAGANLPEDLVLVDLHDAAERLQEVTGRRTTEDLLARIFSRFCIGK